MTSVQRIIGAYWSEGIESMTVKDAKDAFDGVFGDISDDCLEHGFVCPDWDEAFGIWCGA